MNKESTNVASLGVRPSAAAAEIAVTSNAQWGAIIAGSFAGFAATIIMATLGLAIGATTGAVVAGEGGTSPGEAATAFGVGAAVWILLTAIVVGFVGGAVLNRMARYDRPYMPLAFGALTWAGGVALALVTSTPGVGMAAPVAAGGAGAAFAALGGEEPGLPADGAEHEANGAPAPVDGAAERAQERVRPRELAEKGSAGLAAAAWILLGSQLVSLAATMLAARWRKAREYPVKAGPPPS